MTEVPLIGRMNVVLIAPLFDKTEVESWMHAFADAAPGLRFVRDGVSVDEQVEGAIVYYPAPGQLALYPRLSIIVSLSAGVEGILQDPTLPDVPMARVMNGDLRGLMREYVVYQVLRITRRFDYLEECRREHQWAWSTPSTPASEWRVLVLGLGQLGRASATALRDLDFQVYGWSRGPHSIPGVRCVFGRKGLDSVLPESDIVVCLLPLTAGTRGILCSDLFSRLPRGASLINASRSGCVRKEDMLRALDSGQLSRVTLDVFESEPLPEDHEFWSDPRINITPHAAAHPRPEACVPQVIKCLESCKRGVRPPGLVDRARGY